MCPVILRRRPNPLRRAARWSALLWAPWLAACTPARPPRATPGAVAPPAAPPAEEEVGHHHSAPHGGALIPLGEHVAHLELVLDAASGRLTIYVLDGEAAAPVRQTAKFLQLRILGVDPAPTKPLPLTVQVTAVASELTGERVGDTSEFAATIPVLVGATAFRGELRGVQLQGQPQTAIAVRFPAGGEEPGAAPHADHDHDHNHEHADEGKQPAGGAGQ